jgi:hypothetical protein
MMTIRQENPMLHKFVADHFACFAGLITVRQIHVHVSDVVFGMQEIAVQFASIVTDAILKNTDAVSDPHHTLLQLRGQLQRLIIETTIVATLSDLLLRIISVQ